MFVLCSDAPETGLAHFADLYNLALNYCSPQVSISTVAKVNGRPGEEKNFYRQFSIVKYSSLPRDTFKTYV